MEDLLADESQLCMAHAVNLCEVYFKMRKYEDESEVRSAMREFRDKGLVVREDLDEAFWLAVGGHKAALRSMPLADCFVATLAARTDAQAVTADHPDFDSIKEQGVCKVTFIR